MRSRKLIATPPGATIKEQLEDRGMDQKEFALRMDMSEKHISRLINGDVRLTTDVALRLEYVLGVPAQFWIDLESRYQEKCARIKEENDFDADILVAKKFPYSEMVTLGWIEATRSIDERVKNLRAYFQVAKLGALENLTIPGIAYRRTDATASNDYALAAWSQKARLEARSISVSSINITKLGRLVPQMREMTTQDPNEFCPKLISMLAECGVALVLLPHMKSSFLHGASFYDGKKIVMGLTVRGHYADRFWFSFFHEIGHILNGHISKYEGPNQEDERIADDFSANTLIPGKNLDFFLANCSINERSIQEFADSIGIDAGIVVGRLQKMNILDFSQYNGMKTRYALG